MVKYSVKGRKFEELVGVRVLPPTRDRLWTIKNENRIKFQNADLLLNYLMDVRENFLKLKGQYKTKTFSKKEVLDKAKKDYEDELTIKEKKKYYIEEANRIRKKFEEIKNVK